MFGLQLPPAVSKLLIINIGIFALSCMLYFSNGIDINYYLGLHFVMSDYFQPYQFVSYMFLHSYLGGYGGISIMHLLSNMFALFMFGPLLEQFWGTKKFVIYYMVTGIGAGLIHSGVVYYDQYKLKEEIIAYVAEPSPDNLAKFLNNNTSRTVYVKYLDYINAYSDSPNNKSFIEDSVERVKSFYNKNKHITVGASGAVFGILLAFGMLFPNTEMFIFLIPFPIKAKYLVSFYGLYELYQGFRASEGDNVAHFAHIGGMIWGFFLIKYWNKQRNKFY